MIDIQGKNSLGSYRTYTGHRSTLTITNFGDGGDEVYELAHEDVVNAPQTAFFKTDSGVCLVLSFNGMCIGAEEWPKVREATNDMLALWEEYKLDRAGKDWL